MNGKLAERLYLFSENTQNMKKKFIWQNTLIKRLAALLYAAEDKAINCDAIRACYEEMKQNTGLFSAFRGNSAIAIATMLSLSHDKEYLFPDTLSVYKMLKEMKFWSSDYLAIAAYQIASGASRDNRQQAVERARAFYEGMKEQHWFYTGQDDYTFAAMLGLSDINIQDGLARMEELYGLLKPKFFSGNGVQSLTQVLVLGEETDESIVRIYALREALRNAKIKLDKEYTLPFLGILALLPVEIETIVNDIGEACNFLRTQTGFSVWSLTNQELLLLSSAIVVSTYADDLKNGIVTTALCTNITNIIVAQQAALAAMAASSAAAASASSS